MAAGDLPGRARRAVGRNRSSWQLSFAAARYSIFIWPRQGRMAVVHYWVTPCEIAYDMSPSTDKSLAYVYGTTHRFLACTACDVEADRVADPPRPGG